MRYVKVFACKECDEYFNVRGRYTFIHAFMVVTITRKTVMSNLKNHVQAKHKCV